jgi:AcrR family transcriptional regulator
MKHKRSELTRTRIAAAARPLFLANGIDGTPVAAICRAAAVSNGALFHQFPVKEDLAFAVYCEVRLEYWNRVVGAMVAEADPLDGIEAAIQAAFVFLREQPDAAAFMSDVTGSNWIEGYASEAQPLYDAGTQRAMEWAIPHVQSGRLPLVSPDTFVALISGAPQWTGRMHRIGLAGTALDTVAAEMSVLVRRAFTVG